MTKTAMSPRNFPFEQHIFHLGSATSNDEPSCELGVRRSRENLGGQTAETTNAQTFRASIASIQSQEMHAMSVASPLEG
jgi:hypothetical protein